MRVRSNRPYDNSRFVCLAEYKCICRPVGVPVGRNTMLRHRKVANDRRASSALPRLPWGPRYTPERGREVYERFLSLSPHGNEQEFIQPYTFSESNVRMRGEPVHSGTGTLEISNQPSQPPMETRHASLAQADIHQQHVEAQVSSETVSPQAAIDQLHGSAEISDDIEVMQEQNQPGMLIDDGAQQNQFQYHTQEESSLEVGDETIHSRASGRAFLNFRAWADKEKDWVETCIEFSVTTKLFDRVLKLIKAPYRSITVKRNLIKYAELNTKKFLTCKPHMLISGNAAALDLDDQAAAKCDVCDSSGSEPEFSTFEYLPLKPRLAAWFKNDLNYKDLTEYRESKLRERSEAMTSGHAERFYEDYFDGTWYQEIAAKFGGDEKLKNDVFLSISSDGFQTYENQSYDCWPILALNHNLHPSKRFLLRNVISLGYVKGPTEPQRLDTFFIPLAEELEEINRDDGMEIQVPDGSFIRVRVHVLWISADRQARNKMAGLAGQNSKTPCEECEITGIYAPDARHYYFPSKVLCTSDQEGTRRSRFEINFDPDNLPMRTVDSIKEIWEKFENSTLNQSEKRMLVRDTGVKPKTALYRIDSVLPFVSFPHDSMHHIMNVSKDMMELLKGDHRILRNADPAQNEFVISTEGWESIDKEIESIGKGTSLAAFGPQPRPTSEYRTYKAAEWKEFFSHYALPLFEGHLPRLYMKGLRHFSRLIDFCRRPSMTQTELGELHHSAKSFYHHIEKEYFRYDPKRIGIMKSTIHSLLHLRGQVERYGPMTNYNQFWVERRIGDEKAKLNGTRLAAECMTERAKLVESFKLFYQERFVSPRDDELEADMSPDEFESLQSITPLLPVDFTSLRDPLHRSYGTKDLLRSYLLRSDHPLSPSSDYLSSDKIGVYGRLRIRCGETFVVVGSSKARRHRKDMKRADWYVSVEYEDESATPDRVVYYGRIIQIIRYEFGNDDRVLLLMDWAQRVRISELGQVFSDCPLGSAFRNPTIEDASIILNPIGVCEHKLPNGRRKTFFLDPQREAYHLLDRNRSGVDGINRYLKGAR